MTAGAQPVPPEQRVEWMARGFVERLYPRHAAEGVAIAPGRVNLIGEHVDYNEGLVLPFAIDQATYCMWARRDDDAVHVWSDWHEDVAGFFLKDGPRPGETGWKAYVHAVVRALLEDTAIPGGIDMLVYGDVPQGAGLSSSASLEVALAGALRDAFELAIDDVPLAQLCQRAENEFVGVQCGIMDQFASVLCERAHALLIDCRTLAHERVPLRLEAAGLSAVVVNSGVVRELSASAYNERRRECHQAVEHLGSILARPELASLRDVSAADMERGFDGSVPMRRARHVVSEIGRVAAAVDALASDDFTSVGALMQESHDSLRDDYEVSCSELDLLVALASAREYVIGSRLTGAGFGGCTINLVRTDALAAFEGDVVAPYRERTGLAAEVYVTAPSDGLRTWRL